MKEIMERVKNNKRIRNICLCLAALVLVVGGTYGITYWNKANAPKLTSFVDVDPGSTITIDEDEVPLGNTKITTQKNTKTTKKMVKLKEAPKKSYTVKKPTKTRTTKKTTKSSKEIVTVKTTTATSITEKYKKKTKKKVVTTKVTTTVQVMTTELGSSAANTSGTPTVISTSNTTGKGNTSNATGKGNSNSTPVDVNVTTPDNNSNSDQVETQIVDIETIAPKADPRVLNAYNTLGFDVTIDPSVSYSGYFNAKSQQIILKKQDDTIYHELGHFLAFLAGNVDQDEAFVNIYNAEKDNYTGVNKAYVTQSSSEYFAESFKDYVLNPNGLESSRPETYNVIVNSLDKLTDSYVARIKAVYSFIWK